MSISVANGMKKLLMLFFKFSSGGKNSNRMLMTIVIFLVGALISLVVAAALLFIKMKRIRGNPERVGQELAIDNALEGKNYANDDNGDGREVKRLCAGA